MRYRIEYADGRCCNFANGRADLLEWLKLLEEEEIADIRKVYKKKWRIRFCSGNIPELYPFSIRRGTYGYRY